jgi:hypothetical protein
MEAVGSTKPSRSVSPPTVNIDGWHLIPKGPEDVFVDQILEEWVGMSCVYTQSSDPHFTLHADAISTLKKSRLFSSCEEMYFFLCKDSAVPTSESVCLLISADVDENYGDYGGCKIRLQNLFYKPSLLNDAESAITASTKLVACMIELMTKFGVWLDLDHLPIKNVYTRLLHDKLSFWGANVASPESGQEIL